MDIQEKIKKYVECKKQIRDLENALKFLEPQIKEELKEKVNVDGFVLSKKSRISYSLKEGINLDDIKSRYPGICKTTVSIDTTKLDPSIIKQQYPDAYCENISVEAKKLYEVAENPKELVEEKITEYLEVKESKTKEPGDLDF